MKKTKSKRRSAFNAAAHTELLAFMEKCLQRRENGDYGSVSPFRALLNRGKESVCRYRLPDALRARYGRDYLQLSATKRAGDSWRFA